jgi:hypothetical protein
MSLRRKNASSITLNAEAKKILIWHVPEQLAVASLIDISVSLGCAVQLDVRLTHLKVQGHAWCT